MSKKNPLNPLHLFVIAYVALQLWLFPAVDKIEPYNLFFELIITIILFFSLTNLNKVKYSPHVHRYLVSGFFFLFVTMLTDTLDEVFTQPWLLTTLFNYVGQLVGYILISYGINQWITQNSSFSFKLKTLSETDELTGLFARRHFSDLLKNVLSTQHIEKNSFSILLINIDNFKLINEQYSQAAGDIVLQRFSHKLKDCVRKTDSIARWGGEEFIILLNNSNDAIAKQVAETVRAKAELLCVEYKQDIINITASIGAVTYKDELKSSELINKAQQCLVIAKQQGKNQVYLNPNIEAS